MPHAAWLPWSGTQQPAEAWQATIAWPQDLLATLQIRLGAVFAPGNPVAGAIGVAAAFGAAVALVLAAALRAAGLGTILSTLVAAAAASAPLLAWQAGSPLGNAPASLLSALLLWRFVRQRVRMHVTWFGSLAATAVVGVGIAAVIGLSLVLSRTLAAWPASATLGAIRADVGVLGLLLLSPALGRRDSALVPRERVWLALAVLWLCTTPMAPTTRAAFLLPWVWWLIGAGIAQLVTWRGRHAVRWAAVGVLAWTAVHAARVPWGQQQQLAALTRTWAEGIATRLDAAHPLVFEDSARGRLVATLARERQSATEPFVIPLADAYAAARSGRRPVAVTTTHVEALRWGGLALDVPEPLGVPLERLVDSLPRGTIVIAAIAREAAREITPVQWQSLGRLGLRLADTSTPRAHVVAGVTRARAEALEVAHADAARLDVQPGDPLGRTGSRSPVDAQIEAGARTVAIALRGRPVLQGQALALLFFSPRGDFLGWRAGSSPAHLDGPALGNVPLARGVAVEALPCTVVEPNVPVEIGPLTHAGGLGITWGEAGEVRLQLSRVAGDGSGTPLVVGDPRDPALPTLTHAADEHVLSRREWQHHAAGVLLRGDVSRGTATATVPVRVCAAWPMLHAVDPAAEAVAMRMLPRFEPYFAAGWHDMESAAGSYFRWMNGGRAEMLLALRRVAPIRVTLDAQGVKAPGPADEVRLVVNGQPAGRQPVQPTRGLYDWHVPASLLRPGMNTLVLETTLTMRPADLSPGGDARMLGLLVYGWTFGPGDSQGGDAGRSE